MTEQPQPQPPKDVSLMEWRLSAVEKKMDELVTRSEGWHSSLGSQITGLSNQIGTTLAALPGLYSPRPEAEERHRAIGERFEDVDRRFADHGHDAIAQQMRALEQRLTDRATVVDDQIKVNRAHIERIEQFAWGFVVSILMLTVGVLFAIFRSGPVGGGA